MARQVTSLLRFRESRLLPPLPTNLGRCRERLRLRALVLAKPSPPAPLPRGEGRLAALRGLSDAGAASKAVIRSSWCSSSDMTNQAFPAGS